MVKKRGWVWLIAVFLLLLPVLARGAAVSGVTDNEVVIGTSTPLSGPAALWGVTGLGMKAWAEYINEQGGIHGRKIKFIMKDDGYNPARAVANLTEMKGQVFAVAGLLGTAILNATKDFFPDNKIPLITAYGDVRIWTKVPKDKLKYIFIAYPDYANEAEFLADYALKSLGTKKLAMFYQNDDYGKMAMLGAYLSLSHQPGKAKMVATVPYEVTERALSTHALKIKESGADTLLIYSTMTHGALILKEMAKIGYRPKSLLSFPVGDPIMYNVAGADVWEGVYPAAPANSGIPGDKEADRVIQIIKKYEPKIAGKEYLGLFGAVSMMHVVEGLKNAGRNLTPETMIKGMEMIKNWKPEGIGGPVTYSPDRRHGVNGSKLMKAEKGKHVPITDYVIYKPLF
jgi:ABC-type branched-subunit amino acid transport system substrate-binding protein